MEHTGKRALVLAGGGAKGSYQIGVWRALQELDWTPDIITGASVGTLNGCLFTMGKIQEAEKEIAAFLQYQMLLGGAEKMSFEPIVVSGANSSMPHGVPTEKQLAEGDFVTLDFGCVYQGYSSDMTRTVAMGSVTEEMDKVYHTVLEAQLAGIAAVKAGVTGKSVHQAAADVISKAGYGAYFGHGFGHSLGIDLNEAMGASLSYDKPLPAGAVISAEPGIYLPGRFGVRIEDMVIIKEDGCEDITLAPKELLIL
mgnify:CR=1 FL=1